MKYLGVDHFVGPPPANQLANSKYAERTSQLVRTLAWLVPHPLQIVGLAPSAVVVVESQEKQLSKTARRPVLKALVAIYNALSKDERRKCPADNCLTLLVAFLYA